MEENEHNLIIEELDDIVMNILHDKCVNIEKNDESSDGNVYIIETIGNKYVAKVYEDKEHAESMILLHKSLPLLISVPKLIYTNYECINDSKKYYIVIYSFINGKPIDKTLNDGKVGNDTIISVAKLVRKMHDMTLSGNKFKLPELPFDTINKRKTLLHFDLTKSNIFLDECSNISIIDFDDAMYGSAIYDIAILISTFFFSKSRGIDIDGMNIFLDAYYGNDLNLKNEEINYIKECSIQWIDYLISNNKLSQNLIDSFKIKRTLISENL
ncbi:MAG: phosphotransferase [Clostridia bacterium]|nr:phosphotransferase [Clostridia bacterium]